MPPKRKIQSKEEDVPSSSKASKAVTASPSAKKEKRDVERIGKAYSDLFRKNSNNFKAKYDLFEKVVDEENYYRELFAQDRESKELADPYLLLIPAHDNTDIFKIQKELPEEANMPQVFKLNEKKPAGTEGIVNAKDFQRNFDLFTEGQLKYLNWDNVFVAGGSVLAALTPPPGEHGKDNTSKRNYYHKLAYLNSDIDLFIYGLETEEAANKKLEEIYYAISEAIPNPAICFRSQHAVTIISQFPYRHIQIILRLYKSPAEILMGFDVDVCSLGYDGQKVWMTPRSHRAITHQSNTIDMTRRSPTYEQRLAKYSSRGFAVNVPSLDRSKIDPQLFERRFDQLQGLAKLILLEKLATPEARTRYKEQQRLRKLRPSAERRVSFLAQLSSEFGDDEYSRQRIQEGGGDASDYSTVFLPWGPKWTAERVRKLMYTKDMILNSQWYDPKKKIHTHPCFFGTASEIIKDCCGSCPQVPEDQVDPDSPYVSGKITWVTVNPGAQTRIGSFHPITEGDWTEGAYISPEAEKLFFAVNANDTKTIQKCIEGEVSVNSRDPVGRTPLQLAAFSNSIDAAKALLKNGARISPKMSDGRTALHIAAAYGHEEIVKLILEKGKALVEQNAKSNKGKDKKSAKKPAKKSPKKAPKKSKKKKGSDDEDEMDEEDEDKDEMDEEGGEDEEMDEEGGEEGEEDEEGGEGDEGEGDGEMDEDYVSIKQQIEDKKKAAKAAEEAEQPSLDGPEQDVLDIEATDWDLKMTPLHFATFFGHKKILDLLLKEENVDVTKVLQYERSSYTILTLALISNNIEVLQLLLEKGAPINQLDMNYETVLHKAVFEKNFKFVEFILNWKNDKKVNNADGNNTCISIDKLNQSNMSALNVAIQVSTRKKVEKKKGEDDDDEDENEDEESQETGESDPVDDVGFDIVKLLVEKGAKVQYDEGDLPSKAQQMQMQSHHHHRFGNSGGGSERSQLRQTLKQPFNQAVETGSPRLVAFFIKKGADVNWIQSNQQTAVDSAQDQINNYEGNVKNILTEEDMDQKKALLKQIEKCDPKSFSYLELQYYLKQNYPKEEAVDAKKEEEDKKKQLNGAKYQLQLRKDILSLLKKAKGVAFIDLKLTAKDEELKEAQKNMKENKNRYGNNYGSSAHDNMTITFSSIPEPIPGQWVRAEQYSDEQSGSYLELFDAIVKGDIKAIEKLTIKQEIGKQVHVCCSSGLSNRSPIDLAIELNDTKVAVRLLEIAIEQFTPLKLQTKEKKDDKAPLINNYDLANLMRQMKPGQYLDRAGMALKDEKGPVDPNAPLIQLNCCTSPSTLLKHKNGNGETVVHTAASKSSTEAIIAVLDLLKKKNIANNVMEESDHPKHKSNEPKDLATALLLERDGSNFTPFELAICRGNVELAKVFLEKGGVEVPKSDDENVYEGLDVGGKKMDWALEHRAPPKKTFDRTSVQLAAYYNQVESINFLLSKDTAKYVEKYGEKLAPYFDLKSVDNDGNTVCHYAVSGNAPKALKAIIDIDAKDKKRERPLMDIGNKEEMAPIAFAASVRLSTKEKKDVECLRVLVEAKANLAVVDKVRGWTPLHFAAASDNIEAVELLLKSVDAKTANLPSSQKQTPLTVASFSGNHQVIKLLLTDGKVNAFTKDIWGDFALHDAIKEKSFESVKLLLPKAQSAKEEPLNQENGSGLTPLDCVMLKMTEVFHIDRLGNSNNRPRTVGESVLDIYNHLQKVQDHKRVIVKAEIVNNVCSAMMDAANKKQDENLFEVNSFPVQFNSLEDE